MKRVSLIIMAMMMCVLSGCTNYAKKYDKNTIIVKKNASIIEVAVENFKDASIGEDELKSYVEEQIQQYNDENGKNNVKQKSINTDDMSQVKLVLAYKDVDSFNGFNAEDYILDDFSNIKESKLKGSYTSAEGKSVKYDKLKDVDKAKVLIIPEAVNVVVSGDILYYNKETSVKDDILKTTGKDDAVIIFK